MQTYSQAIAEVKRYIADKVRLGIDVDAAVAEYVSYGIEKGANSKGQMSAEIRGSDSASGNPIPFEFEAVEDST